MGVEEARKRVFERSEEIHEHLNANARMFAEHGKSILEHHLGKRKEE